MSYLHRARIITGRMLVIALVLTLVGCPSDVPRVSDSASIIDLDKELVALYREKIAAPADAQPGVNSRLAALATRAARQGDNVSGDPSSAISFYRIAATAAWAAGPPHNKDVPEFSERGTDACTRSANPDASQRSRDCTLLKMASNLALLDVKTAEVDDLLNPKDVHAPKLPDGSAKILPASFDRAVTLSQDVSGQIQAVLKTRSAAGPQSESLEQYLQTNLNSRSCMLLGLLGRLDASSAPDSTISPARKAAQDAQAALQAASMPITCQF